MKKWPEILQEEVSSDLQGKVIRGTEAALAANRAEAFRRRRTILVWASGLLTAGLALFVLPRIRPDMGSSEDISDQALIQEIQEFEDDGSELMAELELLEDLELLEQWNGEV